MFCGNETSSQYVRVPHHTFCLMYQSISAPMRYDLSPLSSSIALFSPAARKAGSLDSAPMQPTAVAKFLYQLAQDLRDSGQYSVLNALTPTALCHNFTNSWDAYIRLEWLFSDYASSVPVLYRWVWVSQSGAVVLSVRSHCSRCTLDD